MTPLPNDLNLVAPERRADVLIDRIIAESNQHARKRSRSFTARDALSCLEFEALLVATAASNVANGIELSDDDRRRIWLAYSRISTIAEEAVG